MMTETEVQLLGYVEGILRSRGYTELAESLGGVVRKETERRARLLAPPASPETSAAG